MSSINEIKVWPLKKDHPRVKANGVFTYDGVFKMKFTLLQGPEELFVSFPGNLGEKIDEKTGKKIFYPDIKCIDKDVYARLKAGVIAEYNKVTGNEDMNQGEGAGPENQAPTPTTKRDIPW